MDSGNVTNPIQAFRQTAGSTFCHWRNCLMLVAVSAIITVGCGESNPSGRLSVSGEVTWNGHPLKTGKVLFLPEGKGRSASAHVVDGKFKLPAEKGIPVGKYKVRITCEQPTGKTITDPEMPDEPIELTKQILPARYNKKTELTLVVEGPPVTASFDLSDK